jgi:hypothetical protein
MGIIKIPAEMRTETTPITTLLHCSGVVTRSLTKKSARK